MRYKQFEGYFFIRLEKGEKVIENIIKFCKENNIKLGYFYGIGAVSKVILGHYFLGTKEYTEKEFEEPLEIASLFGNITMMDDEVYIHVHGSFSDNKMEVKGGHVKEAVVSATAEIVLHKIEGSVGRKYSEDIGLNLLNI
ncbi:MAG: DNA-binding protein [Nanoarchaeota archaeon]|nr:DNA-binding protein [Nanoarchaeota archaeon]